MYLQRDLSDAAGLGACVVPRDVTVRKLICTDADLRGIGGHLGLGRDPVIREVRATIEDALRRAVVLIETAESVLRRPRATGQAGDAMRARFREAFGRNPEFVPSWRPTGQTWDIGAVVRERLRCAEKIMSGGEIEFVAWGPGSCPFAVDWGPGTWAAVLPGRYRICLGQRFWQAARERDAEGMATTLLHECLHIYFDTIRHRLERWSFNRATCYERYVLVANGMPIPPAVDVPCPTVAPLASNLRAGRATAVAGLGNAGTPVQNALKAIGKVLALNPKDGYIKGSAARARLDQTFASIDDCIAGDVAKELTGGRSAVAQLYRGRLHIATQSTMLSTLLQKAKVCRDQIEMELRRREREAQQLRDVKRKFCELTSEKTRAVEEICRKAGESSDACRELRAAAQRAKEEDRAAGITCQ